MNFLQQLNPQTNATLAIPSVKATKFFTHQKPTIEILFVLNFYVYPLNL
jgi:hypothetical protein